MAGDVAQSPPEWLRVAQIVRPHGHRGEIVAEILTDFPDRFQTGAQLTLIAPGAAPRVITVERGRLQGGRIILKLSGCDSMDAAEQLRGWDLAVPWQERRALDADAVYIADLLGGTLVDSGNEAHVGTIAAVDRESTHIDLLVIERAESGAELLVPFAKAYHPHWDAAQRILRMELPAGLLDPDPPLPGEGS